MSADLFQAASRPLLEITGTMFLDLAQTALLQPMKTFFETAQCAAVETPT